MKKYGYQINKKQFDTIIKTRSGKDLKKNPYTYVMEVINRENKLLHPVTRITVVED